VLASIATWDVLYGAAVRVGIRLLTSLRSEARASFGRLSFGAMYRSGPEPAPACVSKFVKRFANGTSVTVTVRPGFAAMTLATILSKVSFSVVPDAP